MPTSIPVSQWDAPPDFETRRQHHLDRADHFRKILDRMSSGEAIPHEQVPWDDRDFQTMVNARLAQLPKYKQAAADLAVISRIFGGKP